ncbi:MAG: amidohydrolase family protein [Acidobacteria bacterium]|nr:amidohydrolase family protein [Acidobacteriota bacterium]
MPAFRLANAHTHIYSGLAPLGLPPIDPPPRTFLEILERLWWRLDRALDADALGAAARFYVADALLRGTSALIDHHESPSCIEGSLDVIADACQELGMRAVLCYGATERNGGREEAARGLAEGRRFARTNRRPLVRAAIGLHASFTVSDDTIREAGSLCRELQLPLHVHVAEDHADVDDARRRGYDGPLERLHALGALVPGSILAHGVHLSRDQVRMAEAFGCWIVQNPRSNRHNGVGYPACLAASTRVALGTDGFPADMIDELDVLRQLGEAHGESRDTIDRRMTSVPDLVAERFAEAPPGAAFLQLPGDARARASALKRLALERLVVDGRLIVDRGKLLTGDIGAIEADARAHAARISARMREMGRETTGA